MKYENKKITEQIKNISVVVSLLLTLGGVAIGLINYLTLNQLQPFGLRLNSVEKQLQAHETEQKDIINNLATKSDIQSLQRELNGRFDNVNNQLNKLIFK